MKNLLHTVITSRGQLYHCRGSYEPAQRWAAQSTENSLRPVRIPHNKDVFYAFVSTNPDNFRSVPGFARGSDQITTLVKAIDLGIYKPVRVRKPRAKTPPKPIVLTTVLGYALNRDKSVVYYLKDVEVTTKGIVARFSMSDNGDFTTMKGTWHWKDIETITGLSIKVTL